MPFRYKALALTLILLTASVYAQSPPPASPMTSLLRHRADLQLSKTQVRRLYELDRKFGAEARPLHERILKARAAERRLRAEGPEASPDLQQRRARYHAEMRRDAAQINTARESFQERSQRLLTPSQRKIAAELASERSGSKRVGSIRSGSWRH